MPIRDEDRVRPDPAFALRAVNGRRPMTLPDEPHRVPSARAGVPT
jgi:hypothetical protein